MNLGELETDVLRKLWINPNEDSNGFPAPTAFGKYSQYRIRKKLNKAYSDMVTLAKALRSWFVVTLKANYTQYPVPLNCFDIDTVYYYSSATTYSKLEVYEEDYIETLLESGWRTASSVPAYAYTADKNKMVTKIGIAPAPSVDGTAITLASGVYNRDRGHGVIEAIKGSAAPGSANLVYVDSSGQNFAVLGVIIGLTVLNITDGSSGVISTITTTNTANDTITCNSLSGGGINTFTPGDEIRIVGGEYSNFVEISQIDADFLLAPNAGQLPMPGITMAAGNLLVRGFMQPLLLISEYQYPELNPTFHEAIAYGAAASLGMEEPADSPESAQAKIYQATYNESIKALNAFAALQYKGQNVQLQSRRS
jgi:hypothetical protein